MSRLGIAFQTDKPFAVYAELAELVDRYDFETISVYEDLFYQPAWPALFQFAMHTRTGLIGPSVVNPYLTHPVRVAAHVAMLDELSKGRAYFGVGRGAFSVGFEPCRHSACNCFRGRPLCKKSVARSPTSRAPK